tara:strand:- start:2557 stop:3483 length:927 start_codon:yes stop_codon:yes gene_type:complete
MGIRLSGQGPTRPPVLEPAQAPDTFLSDVFKPFNADSELFGARLGARFGESRNARETQRQLTQTQNALQGLDATKLDGNTANNANNANKAPGPSAVDLRARLRAKPSTVAYELLYGGPWVNLQEYGGMIWPYTPTITYNQDVVYDTLNTVHTNQETLAYSRTSAPTITVAGSFSSQTQLEARYNLACLHFLRLVTKMSFGASTRPQRGTPPPVLYFDAHGGGMFLNIPVVVKNFSTTLPNDPDYVTVPALITPGKGPAHHTTRVPALFDISVTLTVQHTPKQLREWSIDVFRSGGYINSVGSKRAGWI